MNQNARTGGQILVDQLRIQGVDRVTCVPGESYLAVLDAIHDSQITPIVCRNEGGAAMMAEAAGKLTGRPGICFVTRGPGATNASHGIHIAQQDSTPLILFIGQVGRTMIHREAFQEIDYRAVFGSMTKWVVEIDRPDRIPELVARAFRVAMQGRPGPVVIALPEDMLTEYAIATDAPFVSAVETTPSPEAIANMREMVEGAQRPLVILGGSRWTQQATVDIKLFAENFGLPVATSFRRAHLFDATHPNYIGDIGLGMRPDLREQVVKADVLLVIGGRMSEVPSDGYQLLSIPSPGQRLIHVHPGAEELGRVYQPELAVHATPSAFAAACAALKPTCDHGNVTALEKARANYLHWARVPNVLPGSFQYGHAMCWLSDQHGASAIVTNGAGNYAGWIHRHFQFQTFGSQVAPTSGSMGYGVPAAIMAKSLHPDRVVVCFAGDGCFLMNGQEFATAVQYDLPVIFIVVDNGILGTIRMHQERQYPGRVSGTVLKNPDFAEYAKAFGGFGERVEKTDDFAPAFERALRAQKPAILHCMLDPEALTHTKTLSQIQVGEP